ncbi:MAG: PilN domain-containing protein [Burkholderiaceae bacterium]
MILINLLPHREVRRQQRKQAFFAGLAFAAVVGAAIVLAWYTVVSAMISGQQERNDFLRGEIKRLDAQIADVATLKAEIEALKARQKAVEDLQADRNMPVYLLNELVKQTPEGVYLTAIHQTGQQVAVTGLAQTNERISEFLRNAANNSPWLERPVLGSIKATNVTVAGTKDQRRMFDFAMGMTLKRPPAPGSAASAASAPAAASAPVALAAPAVKG